MMTGLGECCDHELRVTNTMQATNDLLKQGGWRVVTAVVDPKNGQLAYVLALMEPVEDGPYPSGA